MRKTKEIAGFNKPPVESTKAVLICPFLLLLAAGGISAPQTVRDRALPLALDGTGVTPSGWQSHHGVKSQLLTTTKGNDVIVLIVEEFGSGASGTISAIIDSSGLTFTERVSQTSPIAQTGYTLAILEYYSRATSPLRADNITVVCDCLPFGGMQVLAIHGANTRAIFDPNPSIPAVESCPGPGCGDCTADFSRGTCSASIQTSTLDFVIATTAINDAGACGPSYNNGNPPPGFTTVVSPSYRSSTFSGIFEVDYRITRVPRTNVVFECEGTDAVAIVVDAISFNGAFGTA